MQLIKASLLREITGTENKTEDLDVKALTLYLIKKGDNEYVYQYKLHIQKSTHEITLNNLIQEISKENEVSLTIIENN